MEKKRKYKRILNVRCLFNFHISSQLLSSKTVHLNKVQHIMCIACIFIIFLISAKLWRFVSFMSYICCNWVTGFNKLRLSESLIDIASHHSSCSLNRLWARFWVAMRQHLLKEPTVKLSLTVSNWRLWTSLCLYVWSSSIFIPKEKLWPEYNCFFCLQILFYY